MDAKILDVTNDGAGVILKCYFGQVHGRVPFERSVVHAKMLFPRLDSTEISCIFILKAVRLKECLGKHCRLNHPLFTVPIEPACLKLYSSKIKRKKVKVFWDKESRNFQNFLFFLLLQFEAKTTAKNKK